MSELVLFIDSGDTLVDESTQAFDEAGNVLRAEFFPGTEAALAALARAGVPMVMVADGRHRSFENVYAGHPVGALFAARVYSEDVGAEKPDGRMFRAALAACGLTERDAGRVVMVGDVYKRQCRRRPCRAGRRSPGRWAARRSAGRSSATGRRAQRPRA